MRVAVIGSRDYPDPDAVREFVALSLHDDDEVLTAGGLGMDLIAEQAARERGLALTVFELDQDGHRRHAESIAVMRLAKACDRMVVFGLDDRTKNAATRARAFGKRVEVMKPRRHK